MSVPENELGYQIQTPQGSYFWQDLQSEEGPELTWPNSISVYDKMRLEGKITSVLHAISLPVLRTNWWIDPAGAKAKVVKQVSEDLGLPIAGKKTKAAARTRDRFSWLEHVRMALLMLPHGHSVFEQKARLLDGQARLQKLAWRPPRTITKFEVATDGGLAAVRQFPKPGTTDEVRLDVSRVVVYSHEREGGNWLGRSILRPAYKYWLLKDLALRTMGQVTDRSGNGVPWYTASEPPTGLDSEDIVRWVEKELAAGETAAKRYRAGSNAGGSGPYGSKMELLAVGKLPDTLAWIRYLDQMMGEAALQNFLNLGGENSTGSYALGETFEDFFVSSLQYTAQFIADTATQHVVEDLVDWNFGPDEPAPRIVCDEIGSKHPATAQSLQLLAQVGLITADEPTERWIRSIHGMPEADPTTRRQPTGAQQTDPASEPEPADGADAVADEPQTEETA